MSLFFSLIGLCNAALLWPICLALYFSGAETMHWARLPWAALLSASILHLGPNSHRAKLLNTVAIKSALFIETGCYFNKHKNIYKYYQIIFYSCYFNNFMNMNKIRGEKDKNYLFIYILLYFLDGAVLLIDTVYVKLVYARN